MLTSAKLGLTALAAASLLCAAVSTAAARNLSFSNQHITASWSRFEFTSSLATIRCPVTLEGSFHSRTTIKESFSLIGAITTSRIKNESCTNGTAAVSGLPWHIRFDGFNGILPNLTAVMILIERYRFNMRTLGFSCEYGNATDNIWGRLSLGGGEVTRFEPSAEFNYSHRVAGSEVCPERAFLSGAEGRVAQLGTTTRIRITLI